LSTIINLFKKKMCSFGGSCKIFLIFQVTLINQNFHNASDGSSANAEYFLKFVPKIMHLARNLRKWSHPVTQWACWRFGSSEMAWRASISAWSSTDSSLIPRRNNWPDRSASIFAPAASSAEPGGLTPREVFPLLRGVAMQNDIVGMEVVEINPLLDGSGETMLLANRVVREVLAGMAARKKGITDPKYLYPDYLKNTQQ